MGTARSTYVGEESCTQGFGGGNVKERRNFEDVGGGG
jgi:hypothetical protein